MDSADTHIVALLWLPEPNVLRGQTDNISLVIDHTGSGTTSTNIYSDLANVVLSGLLSSRYGGASTYIMIHVRVQFIVRVRRLHELDVSLALPDQKCPRGGVRDIYSPSASRAGGTGFGRVVNSWWTVLSVRGEFEG